MRHSVIFMLGDLTLHTGQEHKLPSLRDHCHRYYTDPTFLSTMGKELPEDREPSPILNRKGRDNPLSLRLKHRRDYLPELLTMAECESKLFLRWGVYTHEYAYGLRTKNCCSSRPLSSILQRTNPISVMRKLLPQGWYP